MVVEVTEEVWGIREVGLTVLAEEAAAVVIKEVIFMNLNFLF